jgi:hypothetical protein
MKVFSPHRKYFIRPHSAILQDGHDEPGLFSTSLGSTMLDRLVQGDPLCSLISLSPPIASVSVILGFLAQ